jgi:hypothetical protein
VEVANGVALEGLLGWLVAGDLGQAADPVALQAAVKDERVRCGIVACSA